MVQGAWEAKYILTQIHKKYYPTYKNRLEQQQPRKKGDTPVEVHTPLTPLLRELRRQSHAFVRNEQELAAQAHAQAEAEAAPTEVAPPPPQPTETKQEGGKQIEQEM